MPIDKNDIKIESVELANSTFKESSKLNKLLLDNYKDFLKKEADIYLNHFKAILPNIDQDNLKRTVKGNGQYIEFDIDNKNENVQIHSSKASTNFGDLYSAHYVVKKQKIDLKTETAKKLFDYLSDIFATQTIEQEKSYKNQTRDFFGTLKTPDIKRVKTKRNNRTSEVFDIYDESKHVLQASKTTTAFGDLFIAYKTVNGEKLELSRGVSKAIWTSVSDKYETHIQNNPEALKKHLEYEKEVEREAKLYKQYQAERKNHPNKNIGRQK